MDWHKDQALFRITSSRRSLWICLQDLSQEKLISTAVEGVWTTKDLIGHISAWDCSLLEPLKIYLERGTFSPEIIPNHDVWNAVQAEVRKNRLLNEIIEESNLVREELLSTALKLNELQWSALFPAPWGGNETFAQMIDGLAWHEEEHTKSIQAGFNR